jgi:hypothetical protein
MPATKHKHPTTTTPAFDDYPPAELTEPTNGDTPEPTPAEAAGPAPPAEETPDLAEIPFRGTTFTLPKSRDEWNTDAYLEWMEAVAQNLYPPYIRAAKLLLGPTQWAQLQSMGSAGRPAAVRKDFDEFLAVFLPVTLNECVG